LIKRNENNEFQLELGPLKLKMRNAPKWGMILISIGIMFMLIIWAHAKYRSSQRAGHIRTIASKFMKGKPLSDEDTKLLETLTPQEEDTLFETIEKKSKIEMEIDGLKIKQDVAPGTKLTIMKDGEEVSIEKGMPNE
jgi:hypothetical protein